MDFKKGAIGLIFIVLFSICVSAISVSPGKYEINFEPGFEGNYFFDFDSKNSLDELEIYAHGNLSDYITLDTKEIIGSGRVFLSLKLPEKIEPPGKHVIRIGARPFFKESDSMVGAVAGVRGAIVIHVPYPGQYADIVFEAENVNAGENIPFKLEIFSRGNEDIITKSRIEIYDGNDEKVQTFNLGQSRVPSKESIKLDSEIETKDIGGGNYKVVAIVEYGGLEVKSEKNIKLGTLNVKIINYTKELKKNEINPFEIEVESLWNDPIENLYSEVFVIGTDISFLTPSMMLYPWQKAKLQGFFDTTNIESGKEFRVKMVLHYGGESSEETAYLTFVKNRNRFYFIGAIIFAVIAVLSFVVWIILKFKKLEKNAKHK